MATEIEVRLAGKRNLLRVLKAQHMSSVPKDFVELVSAFRVEMEPEDVKLVLQEFEEWKKSL